LRPSIFVGSSREELDIAREISVQLRYDADVTLWNSGVFGFTMGSLESLEQELSKFDFAIFVLSPDDHLKTREEVYKCPRDNVIFELGLLMGHLGRDRVFVFSKDDDNSEVDLKIPSDLEGIYFAKYGKNSKDIEHACIRVIKRINELGIRKRSTVPLYSSRFDFVDKYFNKLLKNANDIKIANICFTNFINIDYLKGIMKDKINSGATFEILNTKRKRDNSDMSYLEIRCQDERNLSLISNGNEILFKLFLFILEDLYPLGGRKFRNFKIKEYPFVPVVVMYIFDDKDMFFGPYIAKDCHNIPIIHLEKEAGESNILQAYNQLEEHYKILSNTIDNKRECKNYVEFFSYYDEKNELSIHDLIENSYDRLIKYLNKDRKCQYLQYLTGSSITYCNSFAPDNDLKSRLKNFDTVCMEMRFDIVMRDIVGNI
jgi:hypothetical protein